MSLYEMQEVFIKILNICQAWHQKHMSTVFCETTDFKTGTVAN